MKTNLELRRTSKKKKFTRPTCVDDSQQQYPENTSKSRVINWLGQWHRTKFPNLSVYEDWFVCVWGEGDGSTQIVRKCTHTCSSICINGMHTRYLCKWSAHAHVTLLLMQVGMCVRTLTHHFHSLVQNSSRPSSGPWPGDWGPLT